MDKKQGGTFCTAVHHHQVKWSEREEKFASADLPRLCYSPAYFSPRISTPPIFYISRQQKPPNNHVENSSGPYQPGGTFQVSTALNFLLYDIRDFELVTKNDFKPSCDKNIV